MTEHATEDDRTDGFDDSAAFDYGNPIDSEQALRIGRAWTEMRRGASMSGIRDYITGHDHSLAQGQLDALDLLARRERTMNGLAARLRIEPSTATRAVRSLVDHGLAERYRSADDGRVVMVRMTDDGRQLHAAAAARRSHVMEQLLNEFSPEERSDLAGMLERFVGAMDRISTRLS